MTAKRILVLESGSEVADVIRAHLRDVADEVVAVRDGKQAFSAALRRIPDGTSLRILRELFQNLPRALPSNHDQLALVL